MKAILLADSHLHRWPQFSEPDFKFDTNRLGHILLCWREVKEYALTHNIKLVIHVGDLGHLRGIIYVVVNNLIRQVIREFKESGIHLVLVAGNHDQANKSGSVTFIRSLEDFAEVIEEFTISELNGVKIAYIPFNESRENIINKFRICRENRVRFVFAHVPVAGSELTEGYKSTCDYEITVDEIQPEFFVGVLLGHYHKSQFLAPNMFYLGCLSQQTFADRGQDKGFWEVNLVDDRKVFTKSLKFIKTHYPEFVQSEIKDKLGLLKFLKIYEPGNFYKVIKNSKVLLPVEDLDNIIIVSQSEEHSYQPRIQDLDRMPPVEAISAYTKYKGASESVQSYGLSVLERLQQEKELIK